MKSHHLWDVWRCIQKADGGPYTHTHTHTHTYTAKSVRDEMGKAAENVSAVVRNTEGILQPDSRQTLTPKVYPLILHTVFPPRLCSLTPIKLRRLVVLQFSLAVLSLMATDSAASSPLMQTDRPCLLLISSCHRAAAVCRAVVTGFMITHNRESVKLRSCSVSVCRAETWEPEVLAYEKKYQKPCKEEETIRCSSSDRPRVWKWRRGSEVLFNLSLFFTTTDALIHFVLRFLPVKLHTGAEDAAGKRQGPVSNKLTMLNRIGRKDSDTGIGIGTTLTDISATFSL